MTTFLVFSITRDKKVNIDTVEVNDIDDDLYIAAANTVPPPYLGESIVVKQDDVRRFKLRSRVVEI